MNLRLDRFLVATLLGLLIAFGFPALRAHWTGVSSGSQIQVAAQDLTAKSLLQEGTRRYEAEQFAAAIRAWNQALAAIADDADRLDQALLQINLSLAYQQLGRWDQAQEALSASFALLQGGEDQTHSSADLDYLKIFAKALNTQGQLQWRQGEMAAAGESWRRATAVYDQAGDAEGVTLSLINLARALQAQGLYLQASEVLEQQVYQILQREPLDPAIKANGFRHLGNARRRVGLLVTSLEALQESLKIVDEFQLDNLRDLVQLDLGNASRALGDQAAAIGDTAQALRYRNDALDAYQQAAIAAASPMTQLQANLNQLSLLIEIGQRSEAAALWPTLDLTRLPLSRTAIYAQLNFAKSLMALRAAGGEQQAKGEMGLKAAGKVAALEWEEIGRFLGRVVRQAKELADPIAESYAIGQLGELYELTEQWAHAEEMTQQALQLTEATQYHDGRYRWEWQLGRVLKQQGKLDEAITAYRNAVETLELIRNDLLFIDAEIQFSFRDNVEPIYRGQVELLLTSEDTPEPSQDHLVQAIRRIDDLQLSELENFLRCRLDQTIVIGEFKADPKAAIFYPMILEDHLAVVLELPDEPETLRFHQVQKGQVEINAALQLLRRNLSEAPDRTPEVIREAQDVYQWLIAPFETVLAQNPQIDTLVFVLDGPLRNIPMGVLHDGGQYLLENYAIAVSPRLDLFIPQSLSQSPQVFVGGIGQPQTIKGRSFIEIKHLLEELNGLGQYVDTSPPLLEDQFTKENLKQQLSADDYTAIHLKTHGVFSSDPEETFIVAYEDLIKGGELGELIEFSSQTPFELLVLSACSTAQGDDRAVLGLAGIAVRAGVRSAISTLWEAQDTPNTELMMQFYEELSTPGTTRAQALRQAQLALFDKGYKAPYIWATYVLIGNWL